MLSCPLSMIRRFLQSFLIPNAFCCVSSRICILCCLFVGIARRVHPSQSSNFRWGLSIFLEILLIKSSDLGSIHILSVVIHNDVTGNDSLIHIFIVPILLVPRELHFPLSIFDAIQHQHTHCSNPPAYSQFIPIRQHRTQIRLTKLFVIENRQSDLSKDVKLLILAH
jgi:hypothetical protein